MEAQLVLNRPDSPVITFITTTSYNTPTQPLTSVIHSAVPPNNPGQFKGMNMNEQQNSNKYRICRDFVRGSCRRLYCKYPHVQSLDLVVFCHDFQNNKCPRVNCKWVIQAIVQCDVTTNLFLLPDSSIIRSKTRSITASSASFPSGKKHSMATVRVTMWSFSSRMISQAITLDSANRVHRASIARCHRYSMGICFTHANSGLTRVACIVTATEDSQMVTVCSEMA